MSYFWIFILSFAAVYIGSAWAVVAWKYYQSRMTNRGRINFNTPFSPKFFIRAEQEQELHIDVTLDGDNSVIEKTPADIVILVDHSGSMSGRRMDEARLGAKMFVENINLGDDSVRVGVAAFNTTGSVVLPLIGERKPLLKSLDNLPTTGGGTDLHSGLQSVEEIFDDDENMRSDDVKKNLIIISDGGTQNTKDAIDFADHLKRKGISIYCLTVAEADQVLLAKVAGHWQECVSVNNQEQVFHSQETEEMVRFFENIRDLIEVDRLSLNLDISFEFNYRQLHYLGTYSNHSQVGTSPLRWFLPTFKKIGDTIILRCKPAACIGFLPINSSPLKFISREPNGDIKEQANNPSKFYVAVIPFLPPWIFVSLVHPLLWEWLQKTFCLNNKDAIKQEVLSTPIRKHSVLKNKAAIARQSWQPTICIGLGGAGSQSLLSFKSFIMDASNEDEWRKHFRFLAIDTDVLQLERNAIGMANLEFDKCETLAIGDDLYHEHLDSIGDSSKNPWYSTHLNRSLDPECFDTRNGCSGNRLLGKLSLHSHMNNSSELYDRVNNLVEWLSQQDNVKEKKVILFLSAFGGTGSAIVFDVLHLLMVELDRRSLARTISLIIPDLNQTGYVETELKNANESAFLLELERAKANPHFIEDLVSYPRAELSNEHGFADVEYFVKGEPDAITAAASLALALVNAGIEIPNAENRVVNLQQSVDTELLKRQAPTGNHPAAIINCAAATESLPMFACEAYLENRFMLELLNENFGIVLSQDGKYRLSDDIELLGQEDQLLYLLTNNPASESQLTKDLPLLFDYVFALSSNVQRAEDGNNSRAILEGALRSLPELRIQTLREENLQLASVRILRWVHEILVRKQGNGLTVASTLLASLERLLIRVVELIRGQSFSEDDDVETLILFQREPLLQLSGLLDDYLTMMQSIQDHLQSWVDLLTEGQPRKRSAHARATLGLARSVARSKQIALEAMLDTHAIDIEVLNENLERIFRKVLDDRKDDIDALSNNIYWDFASTYCENHKLHQQLLESRQSPFTLNMIFADGEHNRLESNNTDFGVIQAVFWELVSYLRPWVDDPAFLTTLSAPASPTVLGQDFSLTVTQGESEFIRNSVNIAMSFSAANNFRSGYIVDSRRSSDAFMRGHRHHVCKTDTDAAIIQRIYSQNSKLQEPVHPLVGTLMGDLHRLQRYIYLCLTGAVQQTIDHTSKPVWSAELNGKSYILAPVVSNNRFTAALQFVLKSTCLYSQEAIVVDTGWRPSLDEVKVLEGVQNLNLNPAIMDFVSECQMPIEVMKNSHGYIDSLEDLTRSFFQEMLLY